MTSTTLSRRRSRPVDDLPTSKSDHLQTSKRRARTGQSSTPVASAGATERGELTALVAATIDSIPRLTADQKSELGRILGSGHAG